jgi:transposase
MDRGWERKSDIAPENLALEIAAAGGPEAEVAMEACWGWYWAADVIKECGARLHLAHPLAIAGYANRRVKNDVADATLLADLLRMGRLPEAWVAPPAVRELREEVRYRHKLTRLRSGLKSQVHQVLGKEGVIPETKGIWWSGGQRWLDELRLADAFTNRIGSLRDLLELYDREIVQSDTRIHMRLKGDPGYEAIQQIAGVGKVLAAVFIAEIGDVHRFPDARQLCSWAGLTPCASLTPTPAAGTSPNRVHGCCAGRRSKPSPAPPATGASPPSRRVLGPAAVTTSAASPRPDISSRSSTTGCETARSAASPAPTRREVGHDQPQLVVSA